MTLSTVAVAVLAITAHDAAGHVAPSVDDNNRYLKVTPLRGGFRLAYTVFFGEVPGAAERKVLDGNRDGRIDESEARRFGDKLAAQVAASLQLEVGREDAPATQRIGWTVVDVGLGTTAVTGGSFSVDMITYLCAPDGRLKLRDAFRIPRPGETEVLVEDSPGVTVKTARVGAADDPRHDYRFLGAGGPLTDDGLIVEWTAETTAPALPTSAGTCAGGGTDGPGWPRLPLVLGAVVLAAAAAGGGLAVRRQRRRRRGGV